AAVYPRKGFERIARVLDMEGRFVAVGPALRTIPLRIAVDVRQPALLERLDGGLRRLKAEQAWTEIRNRWFAPPPTIWTPERVLLAAAVMVAGVLVISVIMILKARERQIAEMLERSRIEAKLKEERERVLCQVETHNGEMQSILYHVSHDLKSPLVSIGGFSRTAMRAAERGDAAAVSRALGRVGSNVEVMGRLIEGILDVSRLGREELTPARIDWARKLRLLRAALSSLIDEKQAQLVVEEPLPPVVADRRQFFSMLQNLVANALVHGCPRKGMTVRLTGSVVEGAARIGVIDEGDGIPPEYQSRIFDLFQRLESTAQGTGIGLASVRKIVERHGGKIEVTSAPGAGAAFWVTLPTTAAQSGSSPETVDFAGAA
ncbi:MAG: HAMP domain-containing sensor histidine kinase, partial [Pseudomonadota bacterium]